MLPVLKGKGNNDTNLQGDNSIKDTNDMVDGLIEKHNLSLLAIDPDSGDLMGVMLNGEFHRSEIDVPMKEV